MSKMSLGLGFAAVAALAAFAAAPASADPLLVTHRIPAALANEAVGAVVAACAAQHYTETAVIVDADGVRLATLRGDGAGAHTLDSAFHKAYTAASFKSDTTVIFERAKTSPTVTNLITKLPNLVLAGGGLVIKIDNEVLGGIGASGAPGGDLDDACAKAGLDKIMAGLK